ncbi:hypothetical protein H1R20_g12088, partial [Candolleomyces eurysporus]
MQFSTVFTTAVALFFATLVASSPVPVAEHVRGEVAAREADPQGCRMLNSCI